MTAQEIAIAALEEASHEDDPVDIAVTYKIALEEIAKGGWIPVSERVPEATGRYLVYHDSFVRNVDIAYWSGEYWIANGGIHYKAEAYKAWMPLPEAYKAER